VTLFAEISTTSYILNGVLLLLSLILILTILIQRGKGGGLAGAFGGAGGSSAFGSRAADIFVKITLYLAAIWVLVIMINVKTMKQVRVAPDQQQQAKPDDNPQL
jgi:preprotein translocase subunit SecG